jgi:hypothetical protein
MLLAAAAHPPLTHPPPARARGRRCIILHRGGAVASDGARFRFRLNTLPFRTGLMRPTLHAQQQTHEGAVGRIFTAAGWLPTPSPSFQLCRSVRDEVLHSPACQTTGSEQHSFNAAGRELWQCLQQLQQRLRRRQHKTLLTAELGAPPSNHSTADTPVIQVLLACMLKASGRLWQPHILCNTKEEFA